MPLPRSRFFSFVSFCEQDVRAYASTRYSPRTGINKSAIIVSSSIPLGDSLTQTGTLKVERLGFDLYTALVSMSSPERGGRGNHLSARKRVTMRSSGKP